MPRKQKYKIRVIVRGNVIREIIAKDWNTKERHVNDLTEKYPKADIIAEAHPKVEA